MAMCSSQLLGVDIGLCAFVLEQGQQLVHMFRPSAKIHRIDAEPSAPLELAGGFKVGMLLHQSIHPLCLPHVSVNPAARSRLSRSVKWCVKPLMRVERYRVRQFEAAIAHGPLTRKQHAATVGSVH